jgi:hypothetical protein
MPQQNLHLNKGALPISLKFLSLILHKHLALEPLKDGAQAALFKVPVRTAL